MFESTRSSIGIATEVNGTDCSPKLATMLTSGNAPDVYQMEPGRFADYSRRGSALDTSLGSTVRTDRLIPNALDLVMVDGKVRAS